MHELLRIVSISHPRPGWSVVRFDNGALREIEWRRFADEGPIMAGLADPAYAAKCRLAHHGYVLVWPGGLDWTAGAVYKESTPLSSFEEEKNPELVSATHKPVGGPLFSSSRAGKQPRQRKSA